MESKIPRIMRRPELLRVRGRSNASNHIDIKEGLFVPAIKLGKNSVGWVEDEVASVQNARIAGASDAEIKLLVKRLVAARRENVSEVA